jgi:hypothetical protein
MRVAGEEALRGGGGGAARTVVLSLLGKRREMKAQAAGLRRDVLEAEEEQLVHGGLPKNVSTV